MPASRFEVEHAKGKVLERVLAGCHSGRFTGRLHGRQQQADQRADDGNHHEQFDEREPRSPGKPSGKA